MKLCWIWIFLLLFSTTACSVVGKRLYYEPQADEKWTHLKNSAYPIAEYRCSDGVLHLYSPQVGEVMYSVGPPLIPIFPTFAMFDIAPGEKGFDILIVTEGTMIDPNLQQASLKLFIGESSIPIEAQKLGNTYCHQSSIDKRWWCNYYYFFNKTLTTDEGFRAEINQHFNGCAIPALFYKRKDYSYFYPFIFPFPDEHKQ